VNRVATLLLKRGAAAGLTLFEIAKLCLRKKFRGTEEPSPLEVACESAARKKELAATDPSLGSGSESDIYLQRELDDLVLKLRGRANSL